jgi:hypothetical protein
VDKAEKAVRKLEKLELETVNSLHAITRKHDIAVADLHNAQAGLHVCILFYPHLYAKFF